jgi:hypothetical protein
LRRNRAKDPETIVLVFPHKVKSWQRIRRRVIVSTTGNDPCGGINGGTPQWQRDPEECESDHDRLITNESLCTLE